MCYESLEDAQRQVLIDYFEARLIACELWRTSLNFMVDSPLTTEKERDEAVRQRDAVLVEWGEVMTELEAVRSDHFDGS